MPAMNQLRRTLRQQRNALTPHLRQRFNQCINQHLLNSKLLQRASSIACYLANDGEPSLDAFIQAATQSKCTIYLPVLDDRKLSFAAYQFGDQLSKNQFNIPEPTSKCFIAAERLPVILVPLVGFDAKGNRLGMGGGYYDRSLSFMKQPDAQNTPLLIGIAYQAQHTIRLDAQPWDIPLDAVITENGITAFNQRLANWSEAPIQSPLSSK